MPPIVTPCGSTFGAGFGFGFGVVVVDGVVVVVVVAVVPVSVVVVSVVEPVVVGGGSCAEPEGTSAANRPAAASASALTAMTSGRFTVHQCSRENERNCRFPLQGAELWSSSAAAVEDPRVVRDHGVDAGGEHALETRLVVHRPGEHGRSVGMRTVD